MVPNVTFLILNAFFGHRLKTQPRLVISLIFVILMFTFTSVMVQVDTDTWQHEFLIVTLISVVFININAAIFQGGILGVAGQFPPAYMGAVFSGQAVGGIFASGCNVVFLALGASASQSGFFCFLTSVVFLLTALVAYGVATRLEIISFLLHLFHPAIFLIQGPSSTSTISMKMTPRTKLTKRRSPRTRSCLRMETLAA